MIHSHIRTKSGDSQQHFTDNEFPEEKIKLSQYLLTLPVSGSDTTQSRIVDFSHKSIEEIDPVSTSLALRYIELKGDSNYLTSLRNISQFQLLRKISLRDNEIENIENIYYLRSLVDLEELDLRGNVIVGQPEYMNLVLLLLPKLRILDGKAVKSDKKKEIPLMMKQNLALIDQFIVNESEIIKLESVVKTLKFHQALYHKYDIYCHSHVPFDLQRLLKELSVTENTDDTFKMYIRQSLLRYLDIGQSLLNPKIRSHGHKVLADQTFKINELLKEADNLNISLTEFVRNTLDTSDMRYKEESQTTFYSILSEDDAWKSAQSILPGLNMSVTSRIWNYPIPEETEPSSREASYIMPPTETAMHSFRMEVAEVLAGYDNGHGHTRNRSDQTQSFEEGEGGQTILQETQENKFEKSAETPTNRQGQVRKSSFYEREQEKKNELKKQFRMGQNRNDKENSLGDQKIYIQTGYSPEKERSAEKVAFKQIDEKHHGKMPTEEEEEEEELVDEVSKYNIIRFLRAKYLNFLCPHRNTHKYLQHQLISLGRRKDKQVLRASFDKLLANFFQHHASQANIGLENKKVEENLTKPHQIKKKTKGVQTGQRSIRNRKKGSPRAKFMQLLERTLRETQDNVKELSEELETLKEKYVVKEAELFRKDLELYNKEQEYIAELDDYVQKEQQLEGRLSERESNWTQREHDYLEKYKTFEQKESIYQGKDEEYSRKEQEYASKDLEYAQKEKYFDEKIEQDEAKEREFAEKEQACNRKAQELAQKEKEFAEKIEQYEIKQKEYAGKEEHYMQRIAESERLRAEIEKQYQLKEEENAKAGKHLGEREQVYANKLKEYENEIQRMAREAASSKQIQEEIKGKDDIYTQKEQEYKNKDELYAKKDQEHDEKEKRHAALSEQYKQKLARDAKEKEELEKKYKLKDEEYALKEKEYASKDDEYKRKEKEHKEYEARVAQEDAFRTQMEKVYAIQEEDFAKKDKEFARKAELYLAKDREYAERERGYQARDHAYAQQVAQDIELLNQKQYEYEEKERVLQQKEEEYQAREQSYMEKERYIEQREKQFAELDSQYKQKVEHFEQQNQALKKEYQMKDQVYAAKEELFATKTQEFEDKEKEYVERDRLYMERIAKDAELRKEMEEVYKKKDEEYAEKENKYVELEEEVRAKEDELNAMKEEFHMVLSIKEEEIGQKHEEYKQKELEFIAREKLFEEEYNFYKSKDEEYGHKEREFAQKEHEFEELQKEFLAEDERKAVMIVELQDELLSKEKEYAKKMKEHMQKEEGWRIKEQECVDIYLQIKEAYAEKDAEYARKDDEYKAREAHYAAQEKRLAEMQANAQGTEESPEKETIDFLEKEMEVTLEEERKEHEEEVAKYTETINTQTDKIKELEAQCAKLQEALETNEREKELLNKTLKRNAIKTDAGVQVAIQERPQERSYKLQNSPASISRNLIQDLHKAEDKVFDIEIEPLGNLRYKQYDKVMNRHTGFKSPGSLLRSDMEVLKELPRDENLKTETEDHLSLSFLNSGKKGFGSQTESVFNGQSLNESKGVKSQLISGRIYRRGTMQKDSLANSLLETSTEPIDKILGADAEYLKERKIDDNFGLSGPSILWNLSIEKELKSPREVVKESVQSNQRRATVEESTRENLQGRVSNIETLKKTTQALYENLQEKAKLRQEKLKARLGAM